MSVSRILFLHIALLFIVPFHVGYCRERYDIQSLAEKSINDLLSRLEYYGYENVSVALGPHGAIKIIYENRRYRYPIAALQHILTYAGQHFAGFRSLTIEIRKRDVPLVWLTCPVMSITPFVADTSYSSYNISTHEPTEHQFIYYTAPRNSSFLKTDLLFAPFLHVQFSRPGDPAQLQLALSSVLETQLSTGLLLRGRYLLPVYNEFGNRNMTPYFDQLFLNRFIRLPIHFLASVSVGRFPYRHHGISMELFRSFASEQFIVSACINYLTKHPLPLRDYFSSYFFQASYFFPSIDFSIKLFWGRFLFHDYAWRLTFQRTFREIDFGFTAMTSREVGILTALQLSIPFSMPVRGTPRRFRITTPGYFQWNYRYLPYNDAFILDSGTNIQGFFGKLFPPFIRNNLFKAGG